jgi:hypothetical protein
MPVLLDQGREFQEKFNWRPPTELAKEALASPDAQVEGS